MHDSKSRKIRDILENIKLKTGTTARIIHKFVEDLIVYLIIYEF